MSAAMELDVPGADRGGARSQRLPRGARGGADDRGAGPAREPPGARLGRARVARAGGRSRALRLPAGDLALLRPGRDPRRGLARDADDPAQREGPRVPRRLHDRDGGGDLPALALDRGAGDRGGAPPLLRRHDPRDGAADAAARLVADALRRPRPQPALALPRRGARAARRARAAAPGLLVGLQRARPEPDGAARGRAEPLDRRQRAPLDARARASSSGSSRTASSPSASPATAPSGG